MGNTAQEHFVYSKKNQNV